MNKIFSVNSQGERTRIKAERIEIELANGRQLILDFPAPAWGDLSIEADSREGEPVISLQPGACNLLTLRVDVLHAARILDGKQSANPEPSVLDVQNALEGSERKLVRPKKKQIRAWLGAACSAPFRVVVRWVGEEEGRELNRSYRQRDSATNVLSFVYPADEVGLPIGMVCGDLVLCPAVVMREAEEQNKRPLDHYAHLIVHGMLHLLGHDHHHDEDARRMEALERQILDVFGIEDPYHSP